MFVVNAVPTGAALLPNNWTEHFRTSELSVGTYSIPVGGTDDQVPHREAEVYVVLRGRATFDSTEEPAIVQAGTTIYVSAGEEHRFIDIEEDLALLVIFVPPYTGRSDA
jgi:mannose-6-phosphate isomerase-like protein (cupin superfamily)